MASPVSPTPGIDKDNQIAAVQRWRGLIDAQMHFNTLLMQVRAVGVSIVIAVFGGAALSLARAPDQRFPLPGTTIHLASILMIFALLLLITVFVLDYFYYYRMLLAVVEHAEEVERDTTGSEPHFELKLTRAISQRVSRRRASTVLLIFYGIPFASGLVFLLYISI